MSVTEADLVEHLFQVHISENMDTMFSRLE